MIVVDIYTIIIFILGCVLMIILPAPKKFEPVKRDKAIKTVYCLYRVSTMNQVDENDIPMQRLACHEFVSQNPGWFIRREFYERGVSGYKVSADERDQLQELKACALRKEFDVLLVFLFDRLGRRDDETPFVLRWFYDNGIEVWSVKEGQQVFDSYVDDLMNYIRFWTAKTESIKIALRVRTRLRQMVEEGKYTGGTNPFGYKLVPSGEVNKYGRVLKKMEVEPNEADIVRFIFYKTTVEGVGSQILANTLNDMGVRTHKNCQFQSNTINRILRNPIYCGFYYRSGVLSPRIPELQIIEDDVYNETQKLLEERMVTNKTKEETAALAKSKALLCNNIYCGSCGRELIVTTHTYTLKRKTGDTKTNRRYRYMCTNRTLCRNECNGQGTFSVIKVDDLVRKHLKQFLQQIDSNSQNELIERKYQNSVAELNAKIIRLKNKERKLTTQLKTLYSEVPDSISGKSSYSPVQLSDIINDLKDRIDEITEKLEPLENERADKQQLQMSIQRRYEKYKNLLIRFFENEVGDDERRMIILKLFERITVSRGTKEYDIKFMMRSDYADFT